MFRPERLPLGGGEGADLTTHGNWLLIQTHCGLLRIVWFGADYIATSTPV
jgi:hypothetical protein